MIGTHLARIADSPKPAAQTTNHIVPPAPSGSMFNRPALCGFLAPKGHWIRITSRSTRGPVCPECRELTIPKER